MFTREEDVEAVALEARGWTISAIARHLGGERKAVRDYLDGSRRPGERAGTTPDRFEEFAEFCRIRLDDDPHLWGDHPVRRGGRARVPRCVLLVHSGAAQPRAGTASRPGPRGAAIMRSCDHRAPARGRDPVRLAGALPDPAAAWGWGETAHPLVGTLSHSGRRRAVLAESGDQPHLTGRGRGRGCAPVGRVHPALSSALNEHLGGASRGPHRGLEPGSLAVRSGGDLLGAHHAGVVQRLVGLVSDVVEHHLQRATDRDLALDPRHVEPPTEDAATGFCGQQTPYRRERQERFGRGSGTHVPSGLLAAARLTYVEPAYGDGGKHPRRCATSRWRRRPRSWGRQSGGGPAAFHGPGGAEVPGARLP